MDEREELKPIDAPKRRHTLGLRVENGGKVRRMTPRVLRLAAGLLIATSLTSSPTAGQAADSSLVLSAIGVLEREYVKPVNALALLNAAIAALRAATHAGPETLPDIASGVQETQANEMFAQRFAQAAQIGGVPQDDLAYTATREMLASLHDSQVIYYDPMTWADRQREQIGQPGFVGIGVWLLSRKDGDGISWAFIDMVFPHSPAQAAGLKRFDKFIEIGGRSAKGFDATEAAKTLRGAPGSTVALTVLRAGRPVVVSIARAPIKIKPSGVLPQPGIAYVRIIGFDTGAADDLRNEVTSLQSKGTIRAIILDLRGKGPGWGEFQEIQSVAGVFLPAQTPLARARTRGQDAVLGAGAGPVRLSIPLVVLVDEETAGAAETLAYGLKASHRGRIVGQKTSGGVGGGHPVALPEGGMFVRSLEIVGMQNEQIDGVGIVPDTLVRLTEDDMERGTDTQLDAALKAAAGR